MDHDFFPALLRGDVIGTPDKEDDRAESHERKKFRKEGVVAHPERRKSEESGQSSCISSPREDDEVDEKQEEHLPGEIVSEDP
jgi:hypothetical protein